MKELSIEQKAQRYDEAISIAREYDFSLIGVCAGDVIQDIFPELAESEDEKNKRILRSISSKMSLHLRDIFTEEEFQCFDAWLEKQGKKESYASETMNEKGDFDNGFTRMMDKEQKPIDKVEPKFKVGDKIYLKPEYRMPNDDTPIANTVFEIRAIDDKHYRFNSSYIFIEDQDKYELVEQKPAEWSEDDLAMCAKILFLLKTRVFPSTEECNNLSDWLKSLKERCTWKPSDEQIKVCKEVYADILSAKGFDLGTVNSELNRLEEELKKLREE